MGFLDWTMLDNNRHEHRLKSTIMRTMYIHPQITMQCAFVMKG
jgi:hypothetical protein